MLDGFAHDSRSSVPWLSDELSDLAWSFGDTYNESQLRKLDGLLGRGFDLPPLQGGTEAFLEFDADWSRTFNAWPVVTYEIPAQCKLTDPDNVHLIMGPRQVTPLHCVGEDLLEEVGKFFRGLGVTEPLRAYLVWLNSD